jgi:LacI family transcriptional regulator
MMKKQSYKVDILSVAKAAGVSAATVSRAMNHPDLVNPTTLKKVERAIRKTGYVRNRAAQMIHGRRSATLGLVVPTVNYSIFAELVQSFNDTVVDLGFTLVLATHGYDLTAEYKVLRKLLEHRVDGIALVGLDHSDDTYRLLASQDVPVVAAWSYSKSSRISCIGSDNREAGRLAADHLIALGHRRIGLVFPPTYENDRARGRLEAVELALRDAGIEIPDAWRVRSPYSVAHARSVCHELLHEHQDITGLICGNDIIAQGALSSAMQLGLRIPQDLSIVGIGDFAGSADMYPALSTVQIPAQQIGMQAGKYLVESIARSDPEEIVRRKIQVDLKPRATTGPALGG